MKHWLGIKITRLEAFAYLCVFASLLRGIFCLEAYPPVFEDEPFFCLSALRLLDGKNFAYVVHTDAPWATDTWAYHSPFFFRFLILPLWMFGESLLACRIGTCLLAHAAVALLCRWLARILETPRGALMLAVAWCGGYSFHEIVIARPDGIAMFFTVLGFLSAHEALCFSKKRSLFAAGMALGCAIGFSIATVYFLIATFAAIVLWPNSSPKQKFTSLIVCGLGAAVPAVLFLASWAPCFNKSWEQFWWFVHLHSHSSEQLWDGLSHIFLGGLGIRSVWFIGMAIFTLCSIVFMTMHASRYWAWYKTLPTPLSAAGAMATLYVITGGIVYVTSSLQYYYLVYSEIWVLLLLSMLLARGRRVAPRPLRVFALIVLTLMWIPSAFWSFMRLRESLTMPLVQENAHTAALLTAATDTSTSYFIEPRLFMLVDQASVHYEPLPWFGTLRDFPLPPSSGIIIGKLYQQLFAQQIPEELEQRQKLATVEAYQSIPWFREPIDIYGPRVNAPATNSAPTPQQAIHDLDFQTR